MKKFTLLVLSPVLLLLSTSVSAQPSQDIQSLGKEIEALKEGQKAIQKDLQDIKTLLRSLPAGAPAAPQNPIISVEGAQFKGEKAAKLTLIEFSDFQ